MYFKTSSQLRGRERERGNRLLLHCVYTRSPWLSISAPLDCAYKPQWVALRNQLKTHELQHTYPTCTWSSKASNADLWRSSSPRWSLKSSLIPASCCPVKGAQAAAPSLQEKERNERVVQIRKAAMHTRTAVCISKNDTWLSRKVEENLWSCWGVYFHFILVPLLRAHSGRLECAYWLIASVSSYVSSGVCIWLAEEAKQKECACTPLPIKQTHMRTVLPKSSICHAIEAVGLQVKGVEFY